LVQGNFLSAVSWNPIAFVVLCGLIVFDFYAAIVLIRRARRLRVVDWTSAEKRVVRIAVIGVLALNWIYLLAHHGRY
jgi:hypothetical protein